MYPETARRSLEEIDHVFDTNVKPWRSDQIKDIFGEQIEQHQKEDSTLKENTVHAEEV